MNKEKYLLEVLNAMIEISRPVKYSDFNLFIKPKNKNTLLKTEKKYQELGIAMFKKTAKINNGVKFVYSDSLIGISIISIIATITDILIGKRLGFVVELKGKNAGNIMSAFFQEQLHE